MKKQILRGLRILVTAGPTREYIDPVRFISNQSTGYMGYAIAEAAYEMGARVTLVSGPTGTVSPKGTRLVNVESADQMHRETVRHLPGSDIIFMTAAVADYKPARSRHSKIKKERHKALNVRLIPTRDILAALGKRKKGSQILVGFAAETNKVVANARLKLKRKNLDMIVANKVGKGKGFGPVSNEFTIIFRDGRIKRFARMSKTRFAMNLLKQIYLRPPAS